MTLQCLPLECARSGLCLTGERNAPNHRHLFQFQKFVVNKGGHRVCRQRSYCRNSAKDPKVTAIIVKSVDANDWFAGGKSLAEQKLASFWLDIHVTEGTNTKDEKAAYLAAVFKRMVDLLGPLHNETYLHVDEVRGDAYGFGGLTQERRYIAGKLAVSQ